MKISILGCGWLGLPLAESLTEEGHQIKGSTTSEEKLDLLDEKGIEPHLIDLTPELHCGNCDSFWESDVLVLNIPPGRNRDNVVDFHISQIEAIIKRLRSSSVDTVIFVSSTSVYPKLPGIVEEDETIPGEARRASGNALLSAEQMLMNEDSFDTTIVRFGGLYGYDRHPAKFLAGRKNLDKAKAPVNLIHRDDCIEIIKILIEREVTGEVFNAVSDGHPPRSTYYRTAAETFGLEPPTFKEGDGKDYKVVSNRKLKEKLDYQFKHPNPMNF